MNSTFQHPRLALLNLRLACRVKSPLVWRSYPGSVVHGALGFHLKRRSCVVSHGRCGECFLNQPHAGGDCTYGALYEPRPPAGATRMRKYDHTPSPLRLSVYPWLPLRLEAGSELELHLALTGRAVDRAVPLLLALQEALAQGLGSRSGGSLRGIVEIESVGDAESDETLAWEAFDPSRRLPFPPRRWSELREPPAPVRICFTTPVRLVSGGRVQAAPTFRSLMATLTRRVSSLAYFGSAVEIEADFKGLLERAERLQVRSHLHRVPVQRFSSRQKAEMALDGVIGTMELLGEAEAFLPWLAVGARMGAGKGTGMGFGEFTLEEGGVH